MTTFANKQSSNKQVKLRIHFGLLLRIKQKINLFINDEITELWLWSIEILSILLRIFLDGF
jgi:hypothetical protein